MLRFPPDERARFAKEAQLRAASGRPQIKRVEEPEDVYEDLLPVWNAWWIDLTAGRALGMAASGLTWGDLSRWCEDHGIHGQERLRWCRLLRAMDSTAMAHWNRKK